MHRRKIIKFVFTWQLCSDWTRQVGSHPKCNEILKNDGVHKAIVVARYTGYNINVFHFFFSYFQTILCENKDFSCFYSDTRYPYPWYMHRIVIGYCFRSAKNNLLNWSEILSQLICTTILPSPSFDASKNCFHPNWLQRLRNVRYKPQHGEHVLWWNGARTRS